MSLRSIMIVDDNEDDRDLLIRQIKQANLTEKIFEADDGETALNFLEGFESNIKENPDTFPPTLIFLDINMPIMNGFEFLEEFAKIRLKLNIYNSLVLTMLSSSGRQEEKKKALSYEFVKGYITKMPTSAEELKQIVQKYFPDLL